MCFKIVGYNIDYLIISYIGSDHLVRWCCLQSLYFPWKIANVIFEGGYSWLIIFHKCNNRTASWISCKWEHNKFITKGRVIKAVLIVRIAELPIWCEASYEYRISCPKLDLRDHIFPVLVAKRIEVALIFLGVDDA